MKNVSVILGICALIPSVHAVTINVGTVGLTTDTNQWPEGEPPGAAIDGEGQKYLNFGKVNTGVVVTPGAGSTIATRITLWAANDSEPRDPASYVLLGTNSPVPGDGSFDSSLFTLISGGPISLPASRNAGGPAALDPANSFSATFSNADAYDSYLVLFPTIKDALKANSMQVAEIQLFDGADAEIFSPGDTILGVQSASTIPEPSAALLSLLGLGAILKRRRK
jgi:hypothetical protein